MLIIRLWIRVTNRAAKGSKITLCCMAVLALIPFVFMLAAVDRKIHSIVVKCRRCPGRLAVAIFTRRRETRGNVFGIGRLVEIADMTTRASIRGVVVIAFMTGGTIVGNCRMRPF